MKEIFLVILGAAIGKLTELLVETLRGNKHPQAGFNRAGAEDVVKWKWSGEDLLRRLIALDRKLIGDSLTDAREGTVRQWAPVFFENPDSWALLIAGPKQIVGYWHFAALRDEQFEKAKQGKLLDSEITSENFAPIDVPGVYNLYFVMIGVTAECPGGGSKLIDMFFDRLESLAHRGVYFRAICANAFTKDGKRLCEGFGMSLLGQHVDFGNVYSLQLMPWPEKLRHKRWVQLAELYDRHESSGRPGMQML